MTLTIVTLLVCLAGLLCRGSSAVALQMFCCLFGGTAAILLPALGGATVTPAMLFLPFSMVHAWRERDRRDGWHRVPKAGFWLAILALWGAIGAYYLPRAFAGEVQILTIDRTAIDDSPLIYPLRPVSGNITQTGYAIAGACAFFAFATLLSKPGRLRRFRDAVLVLGALDGLAAAVNLAEYHLGMPSILDHVRTAGYGINRAYESGGLVRIAGTFPETSAFAAFTLPLFAFSFSLWLSGERPFGSAAVAFGLLLFLLASTSGTAYAGLAAYFTCLTAALLWRAHAHGRVPRLPVLIVAGCVALFAIGLSITLELDIWRRCAAFFDETVFRKLESVSGIERGSWNRQAWHNFVDTHGLGVGLGSARASSFPLVLLSNVGALGTVLFLAFLLQVLWVARRTANGSVPKASREAVLAGVISATISATVFDLGVAFFAFAAASITPPSDGT
jgi:hypothetical protein